MAKVPAIIKRTSYFTAQNKDAALSSLLQKNSKIMCTSGSTAREASESLYDGLRRDWTMKFSSLTLESKKATPEVTGEVELTKMCEMEWPFRNRKAVK